MSDRPQAGKRAKWWLPQIPGYFAAVLQVVVNLQLLDTPELRDWVVHNSALAAGLAGAISASLAFLAAGALRRHRRPDRHGGAEEQAPAAHWAASDESWRDPVDNLPPRDMAFTGQAGLLADAAAALDAGAGTGTPRVAVLHGREGVGRSAVALELAHRRRDGLTLTWWIPAASPAQVLTELRRLAASMGLSVRADPASMVAAVREELGRRTGWLLVFAGADNPQDVQPYLPRQGDGEVLVTSRHQASTWPVPSFLVAPATLEEASASLAEQTASLDAEAGGQLAQALDRLPLAQTLVAGYLRQTGMSASSYLACHRRLCRRLQKDQLLPRSQVAVAAAYRLSVDHLTSADPRAVDLLRLLACLHSPIPKALLSGGAARLPHRLRAALGDTRTLSALIETLEAYRLAGADRHAVRVHPRIQELTRHDLRRLPDTRWPERAAEVVRAALPASPTRPDDHEQILRLVPHVLALREHAPGAPEPIRALLTGVGVHVGNNAGSRRALADAVQLLNMVLELAERTLGRDHPEVGSCLAALGAALGKQRKHVEARRVLERALAILEAAYGPEDPRLAHALNNLGLVLFGQHQPRAAQIMLERTVQVLEAGDRDDRLKAAFPLVNLGAVLARQGKLETAAEVTERALALERLASGRDSIEVARIERVLARIRCRQGRLPESRDLLQDALRIAGDFYGPGHPEAVAASAELAGVLVALGRPRDGWQHLSLARRAAERRRGGEAVPSLLAGAAAGGAGAGRPR